MNVEERNCNTCKWKSEPYAYPDWIEHTRKCLNHPHYDFKDWEPKEIITCPCGSERFTNKAVGDETITVCADCGREKTD